MHSVSAYPFFSQAVKIVQEKGRDSKEYAYLLGFYAILFWIVRAIRMWMR